MLAVGAIARDGRGDRRRAATGARRDRPAGLDGDATWRWSRAAPTRPTPRILRPRQRLLRSVGRDQPGPRRIPPLARRRGVRPVRATAAASEITMPTGTDIGGRARDLDSGLYGGRDDDRRGVARHARRRRLLRRHRHCRARRRTWPAGRTRRAWCWSTNPARSARSRPRCRCPSATATWPNTADAVVSVPEIFNYWLQPGRIDVGFLGAAQIDRFANINTTVIGDDYRQPDGPAARCRRRARDRRDLPGGHRRRAPVARTFVDRVDVRDQRRLRHRGQATVPARTPWRRPDDGDHRSRHPQARPDHLRAHAVERASGSHRRTGSRRDRLGSRGRR